MKVFRRLFLRFSDSGGETLVTLVSLVTRIFLRFSDYGGEGLGHS
jgi:hypothetical protein